MSTTRRARARVFFTSTMHTPFIAEDVALLRRHFDVDVAIGSGRGAALTVFRRALAADVSICWFASVYSAFMVAAARLRGKPAVIILGGVDTARDDGIGYGIWRSAWRRPLLRWSLRHATRILAVDASLVSALAASSGLTDLNITVIPTGYDAAFWTAGSHTAREILLVASCSTRDRMLVKGVDVFVDAARQLPDESFVLVGCTPAIADELSPPQNLRVIPRAEREQLRDLYHRALVYCQPSRHEGLPNALCEAMLCGCVPVGARVGGIANAIGNCGFVVEPGDARALVDGIRSALDAAGATGPDGIPIALGERTRARIREHYPKEIRESRLVAAIEELLHA